MHGIIAQGKSRCFFMQDATAEIEVYLVVSFCVGIVSMMKAPQWCTIII